MPVEGHTPMQRARFEAEYTSYMLPYELPPGLIDSAWKMVKEHTTRNLTGNGLSHTTKLEPQMVQALYALQLELDGTLPVTVVTFLRLDIDHRLRQLEQVAPIRRSKDAAVKGGGHRGGPKAKGATAVETAALEGAGQQEGVPRLFVAVMEGEGFRPMMGMSTVDAFCRLTLWDGERRRVAETSYCR